MGGGGRCIPVRACTIATPHVARRDPEECRTHYGDTRLDISNGGKTVYTSTGSNSMAAANRSFSSGKVVWVFRLDEDNNGSECSCFGAWRLV
jgi:hypothetical protein